MAKSKTYYCCQQCGYQSASWLGRCPECGSFGTMVEEIVKASTPTAARTTTNRASLASVPKRIQDVTYSESQRIPTHCAEFDRVLGGGIVPGSLLLLGGEPGIGKSTLLLQTALAIHDRKLLYVSGEESEQQIKMRADRIGIGTENCYVVSETVTQRIFEHVDSVQPELLIVDSIQTITTEDLDSPAASVGQIRQCAAEFQHYAKQTGVPVLLIGHITKDGTLAGPKVLEHIVDTRIGPNPQSPIPNPQSPK